MSPKEFEERMRAIAEDPDYDEELGHGAADWLMMEVLRDLGYGAGVDIFESMDVWYA